MTKYVSNNNLRYTLQQLKTKIGEIYAPIDSPNFTTAISMGRKAGSAIGENSIALGSNVVASSSASHAEGTATTAIGTASHAEGKSSNTADSQIPNFSSSTTYDEFSAVWNAYTDYNRFTLAFAEGSHAEGGNTVAFGKYSHAEGEATVAKGSTAHAEGRASMAIGNYSHAEGGNTKALGARSHAEGLQTIATDEAQHAQGKWNIEDTELKYAHIVGNGKNGSNRSNAHTLDWNGNAWYAGNITVGADNKVLATEKYVDDAIASNVVEVSDAELNTMLQDLFGE